MKPPHNILVITYWSYNDALIQAYTLPYLRIIAGNLPKGSRICLVTLERGVPTGVDGLEEYGIELINFKYKPFGGRAALSMARMIASLLMVIRRKKITTIHGWCTPGGMIGYILSKLSGRELILDSFEPHAEPMAEGNTWARTGIAFKTLFRYERLQLKQAKEVICAVESMAAYSQKVYGITKPRYFAKPACVDLNLFSWKNRKNPELMKSLGLDNRIVCVYAGKFGGLYLERETFDFFKTAHTYWGDQFRVLLLSAQDDETIQRYCEESSLPEEVIVKRFVSHAQIPDYMGLADFAICPMKPLPSRRYGTPLKNGEYWALGLPVVITENISDDSGIIEARKAGSVLRSFDPQGYQKSVHEIDQLLKELSTAELYNLIRPIAETYRNFNIAEAVYREIYGRMNDSTLK